MKHQRWTILQLDDYGSLEPMTAATYAAIAGMDGEIIQASVLGELIIRAAFPHRKAKTIERAVASALRSTPVTGITVPTVNPFAIRRARGAY